jgi:hemerythrin-like metal-binding protein
MVLIEWRKDFCTGVEGIDREHEELIDQINAVYALIDSLADKQRVIDSLGDIYGSISVHFALEEQLMQRHGYDRYHEHKADHQRLLDDIGDFTEAFEATAELDEAVFKQKLADWFQLHFKNHDSRLHELATLMSQNKVRTSFMRRLLRSARKKLLPGTGTRF